MSNDVFRFVSERAVQRAADKDIDNRVIRAYGATGEESPFHDRLRGQSENTAKVRIAGEFIDSEEFRAELEQLDVPLAELDRWLRDNGDRPAPGRLHAFLKRLLDNVDIDDFVESEAYRQDRSHAADSLLALVIAPERPDAVRTELLRAMYLFGLLERLAGESAEEDADELAGPDDVYEFLTNGIVLLPSDVFRVWESEVPSDGGGEAVEVRIVNHRYLPSVLNVPPGTTVRWINQDETAHTITSRSDGEERLSSGDLYQGDSYEVVFADETEVDYGCDHHPAMQGRIVVVAVREELGAAPGNGAVGAVNALGGAIEELRAALRTHLESDRLYAEPSASRETAPARGSRRSGGPSRGEVSPEPAISVLSPWVLPPDEASDLSDATRETIERVVGQVSTLDVPETITRLEASAAQLGSSAVATPSASAVALLGSSLVDLRPYISDGDGGGLQAGAAWMMRARPVRPPTRAERNLARRPGIADLKVVRQEIKRYELGEVAHIENVLEGEGKERVHRRKSTTEETLLFETEREEISEQDVQSTDRFELQTEVDTTIRDDSALQVGATVTYMGPSVTATGTFSYASNHSKEEATREARSYARDVTTRAASRIQERIREQRFVRTVAEVEETNKHLLENTDGNENIVGVYRWADKIYDAQVVNYGRRLLLECIVPEPSSFYLHALAGGQAKGVVFERPEPPMVLEGGTMRPLSPTDITFATYPKWIEKYRVSDVKPPPKPYETIAFALEEQWQGEMPQTTTPGKLLYRTTKDIKIDPDYQALSFKATFLASAWAFDTYLSIGGVVRRGDANGVVRPDGAAMPAQVWGSFPSAVTGELALALAIENPWGFALELEILCERTSEAIAKWQLETYGAIMRAYLQLKSEYDEAVAAAATQAGINIQGRNPLLNRATERAELKKGAISLLTASHFEAFGHSIVPTPPPEEFPAIDFAAAQKERDAIQFFEQAFEWSALTYVFYPYFWGDRTQWLASSQIEDADPIFAAFLGAGAARVVLPVRPHFEQSVLHYLATEQIWSGGQVPQVGDPLYVSIVQEIQEQLRADPDGVPEGDPWEVRLPTTLVMLQEDAELPVFDGP